MVFLYDKDENLVGIFATSEDAMMYAVEHGIQPFKVREN